MIFQTPAAHHRSEVIPSMTSVAIVRTCTQQPRTAKSQPVQWRGLRHHPRHVATRHCHSADGLFSSLSSENAETMVSVQFLSKLLSSVAKWSGTKRHARDSLQDRESESPSAVRLRWPGPGRVQCPPLRARYNRHQRPGRPAAGLEWRREGPRQWSDSAAKRVGMPPRELNGA